jgi:predicted Zn-dependent protease
VSAVAYVALRFAREPDRGVREAQSRANAGDVEGAIGHLREVIEEKGPTQHRVNTLGNLLFQAKRYGEAAAQYRKAEQLGPLSGVCRANLGLALLEGGKPDEALPVLEEAARLADGTPVLEHMIALHTCLALADLGRWPEARAEFQRAETIASRLPRSERKALAPHVEKCRTRLEAAGDGAGEPLRR